ncbi:unnamed protein product [Phytophthora lilii]|uniref:Unnamed protein product n=1 Tax=Phytophthora lilii TaxID=2077276 RepID=A0A9W6X2A6_9STRA|nr:unnamed protein product [Phytophthora lilii]
MEVQGFYPKTVTTSHRVVVKITLGWENVYVLELWVMDHNAGSNRECALYETWLAAQPFATEQPSYPTPQGILQRSAKPSPNQATCAEQCDQICFDRDQVPQRKLTNGVRMDDEALSSPSNDLSKSSSLSEVSDGANHLTSPRAGNEEVVNSKITIINASSTARGDTEASVQLLEQTYVSVARPKRGWQHFAKLMRAAEDRAQRLRNGQTEFSVEGEAGSARTRTKFEADRETSETADPVLELVNSPIADMFTTNEPDESSLTLFFDRRSFVDDICFGRATFDEFLSTLDKLLTRFAECRISVSLTKSTFVQSKVDFLTSCFTRFRRTASGQIPPS